ncbi:50S ribosomal protein L25/general stress protein Ctc [Amphritea sp. 2_MG-2023]|jgi:large subunit ribosomal protein L25|uniref:50S ribosomal protein L25/general stress protein Ctc n=1 Tax=Amphritea TaxID=515417 RepID=UPI001C06E3B2|nr:MULTISPECIES: 50S ribosomal protein L25/general stress protein Ctc [Amphritea]MBU2963956.1 50S ribosomal protein L25/general stress protein Ctc [Amphritea atlantica]MDO6419130.1 50S ribosomal protein L25/general stress protein Ctc [Amphritea sp. 2_MG-2023]MDX2421458.1 50S ribosomal protein L25/general stress protein Ctc [Amphritea sp.]
MTDFVLNAQPRTDEGKGASRRLRHAGFVPAVVYGGDKRKKPVSISLENRVLVKQLEDQSFFSSILTLNLEGKEEKVIVKDMQRHPAKDSVMHIDFQRVTKSAPIEIIVPLNFVNFNQSPAGKASGKFTIQQNTTKVRCLAEDLPEALEVDLSGVDMDQVIHLSSVSLPKGVEIVQLRRGSDRDQGIAQAYAPRAAKAGA